MRDTEEVADVAEDPEMVLVQMKVLELLLIVLAQKYLYCLQK